MDEPGWTVGNSISAIPARGPDDNQRRSFAIYCNEIATDLIAPLAATNASCVPCA